MTDPKLDHSTLAKLPSESVLVPCTAILNTMPPPRRAPRTISIVPASSRTISTPVGSVTQAIEPPSSPGGQSKFEIDALPVLTELSRALKRLVAALPGPIDGPRGLQRVLGIDYGLAWRAYKVATAAEPGTVGADVPRATPMSRLLNAALRHNVQPATILRVRKAFKAFEELVQRHAGEAPKSGPGAGSRSGGRTVFDALIGGIHHDAARSVSLAHRRAAYNATSCTWGIQARSTLMLSIYNRGVSPTTVDVASLMGFVGLHALRKDVPFRLMFNTGAYDTNNATPADRPPLAVGGSVSVLEQFSTNPLPQLQTTPGPAGTMETSFRFEEVGRASAIDVFTARFSRDRYDSKPQPWFGATKGTNVPCEVAIVDMLLPRGWTDPDSARTSTHGTVSMYEGVAPRVPEFEMPLREVPTCLGNDISAMETSDVPRYSEMVRSVLGELGWTDTIFDIYRVRVRYPIMHSFVHLRVDSVPPSS